MKTMNKKEKKMKKKPNSYVRFLTIMFCAALCGGIIGFLIGFFEVDRWNMGIFMEVLSKIQIPLMILILVITIPVAEIVLMKLKKLHLLLEKAEDEEADRLEYEEEKVGSIGVVASHLAMVLTLLSLSINYSSGYIEKHPTMMIVSCILTVLIFVYQGIWQIRYVKCLQKSNPRLQGDPGCMRTKDFQKAWLGSCDEAEKELIYQSGYEAYTGIMRIIPMCAVFAMLGHLMWNTGIFAVVVTGVIWIWTTIIYVKSCVSKRRSKINIE